MKPKIVFIINSIGQLRCLKRIQEFRDHGYETVAYGFERKGKKLPYKIDFELNVLGIIDSNTPYLRRIYYLSKRLKQIFKRHKNENVIYYFFGLDIVFCSLPWLGRNYIYEESDLVHTYCSSNTVVMALEGVCKWVIQRSILSVFTSEGFLEYHFGSHRPSNIHIITNRVNTRVATLPPVRKKDLDADRLSIGFVGFMRGKAVLNFCRVFLEANPHNTFHFFGTAGDTLLFDSLKAYPNCHFHGVYMNPDDLPAIYSQIDLVLATYDITHTNPRFLDPNKLYEAIYFETPVIVSKDTFLAKKVKKMNIGFEVNAFDEQDIQALLRQLTPEAISEKVQSIQCLDKKSALNDNEDFFIRLKTLLTN